MTLTERNLVIEQLEYLYDCSMWPYPRSEARTSDINRALEIMKHQPIKGPGLPVSAGGKEE